MTEEKQWFAGDVIQARKNACLDLTSARFQHRFISGAAFIPGEQKKCLPYTWTKKCMNRHTYQTYRTYSTNTCASTNAYAYTYKYKSKHILHIQIIHMGLTHTHTHMIHPLVRVPKWFNLVKQHGSHPHVEGPAGACPPRLGCSKAGLLLQKPMPGGAEAPHEVHPRGACREGWGGS